MVLVLDIEVSNRALALRKRVLDMGFPCAVSFPPFVIEYLQPIVCILTFQDVAERAYPCCPSDASVLALGEGHVSKMLQICVLPTEALLLAKMEKILCNRMGWQKSRTAGMEGYHLDHGFFMIHHNIQFRIYPLSLREQDKRILMTILTSAGTPNSYRRIEAYSYPYPYHENGNALAETIATHVARINGALMACCHQKCIRYDRCKNGGYVLCVYPSGNENEI